MHIILTANTTWNILNFRLGIIEALLAKGHKVSVFAPYDSAAENLKHIGCDFYDLPMDAKGLSPIGGIKLIAQFKRLYSRLKPDAVFSYTIKNNIFGALAARSTHIKFIPNVTGLGTAFLSGGLLLRVAKTLYKVSFSGLDHVFFQNEDDENLFLELKLVKPEQVTRLPGSGIDLEKFAFRPASQRESGFHFLMVSRLLRDKGIIEYVEASRIVRREFPETVFQILGPLDSENRSAIAIEQLEIWQKEGDVSHLGETDDVRPYMAKADCIVLPSYREGAPRSLIEAAAIGRPIITTDVPGCRAVIDDGVTGYLCQLKDAVSLANAMIKFIQLSKAEQVQMGISGRLKMEQTFNQRIISDTYLSALE